MNFGEEVLLCFFEYNLAAWQREDVWHRAFRVCLLCQWQMCKVCACVCLSFLQSFEGGRILPSGYLRVR